MPFYPWVQGLNYKPPVPLNLGLPEVSPRVLSARRPEGGEKIPLRYILGKCTC